MKIKKLKTISKCIILLSILALIIFAIYQVEKKQELEENEELGKVGQDLTLEQPDRIIYKNKNGNYYIMLRGTTEYSKIYSELYNRTYKPIEGKVYSENEIAELQYKGSFVELDYNTRSKNYVYMLEEKEIGIIRRFTDSGQVIKTTLDNVSDLTKKLDSQTKNLTKYEFIKGNSYTSVNTLKEIPLYIGMELKQRGTYQNGVYQKIITSEQDYQNTLLELNFMASSEMKNVDFDAEKVIITVSKYDINDIKQNVGNIKYKLGNAQRYDYVVNVLMVSNVVNTNCIYLEKDENISNEQVINNSDYQVDERAKEEAQRYLKDTYRIDGMSIEEVNVDSDGNGYIIVEYNYENSVYPIKLNVNSQTETFLGMGYHLESNYGYVLHEMCNITLDTKITDIDNIEGLVKTIEYIAD